MRIIERVLSIIIYVTSIFVCFSAVATCSTRSNIPRKDAPVHITETTNPELKVIIDEFMKLSAQNNVVFKNKVTIGISKISSKTVIGMCTYGRGWREIDIDDAFFSKAPWGMKVILVFHELIHCYCGRDHDHGDNAQYPDNEVSKIIDSFKAQTPLRDSMDGFFEDGCPVSIMYPTILDNECIALHYNHYVKEMFNRCEPF